MRKGMDESGRVEAGCFCPLGASDHVIHMWAFTSRATNHYAGTHCWVPPFGHRLIRLPDGGEGFAGNAVSLTLVEVIVA